MTVEAIIFYIILADSIGANAVSWCCSKWYKKASKKSKFLRHFPAAKGWAAWYLILVLWVGYGLLRLGILPY